MPIYVDVAIPIPIDRLFSYAIAEDSLGEVQDTRNLVGRRVSVPFASRKRQGVIVYVYTKGEPQLDKKKIKTVHSLLDDQALFSASDIQRAHWLAGFYFASLGESLACMAPSMSAKRPRTVQRSDTEGSTALTLTADQQGVFDRLAVQQTGYVYLFGITGSGKTEVFLQYAEHVIKQGKSVLYLVPEIALSYQLEDILLPRFTHRYAVIHSRLSGSERLAEWKRIQNGEVDIVLGTRSAVFAPLRNLGLIIIDEEQDNSYKSGTTPRYHARQVAMHRTQESQALLLMGSATPSVESWHYMQQGVIQQLRLKKRIGSARLPKVHTINMHFEDHLFSHDLKKLLQKNLAAKKQSILFINRRGFAHIFTCKTCSESLVCKNCSIPMVYHKRNKAMLCHYCGYSRVAPQACPFCNSLDVCYQSFGSQHVEEELQNHFPGAQIARLDSDTSRVRGVTRAVFDRFRKGEIDILFGTQMISKGLDFPNVTLVAIISADIGLNLPDFRAAERSFSQIIQVSGRAGRSSTDGIVLIQTHRPKDHAIQHASTHSYEAFYTQEIALRRQLQFPPFTRFIRVVFRAEDESRLEKVVSRVAESLPTPVQIDILGPTKCPIEKIARNYRMHIIFSSKNATLLHEYVKEHLTILRADHTVYAEVDVDPVHTS